MSKSDRTNITLSTSTREMLRENRLNNLETYDSLLCRLIITNKLLTELNQQLSKDNPTWSSLIINLLIEYSEYDYSNLTIDNLRSLNELKTLVNGICKSLNKE